MFEVDHHHHGQCQSENVCDKACVEVGILPTIQTVVESQQKCDVDSRNDDIAQTEHCKLCAREAVFNEILGKDEFDWCIKRFGHSDHHVGAEHPEDIVDEQAAQENAASDHIVQVDDFDCFDRKCKAKQIIGHPVLTEQSELLS